jgi:excisionase family DNA binding protein
MLPHDLNLTKIAYSVNELLAILPLGRTSLYDAIKKGKLRATKFGKKTLFLAPDIAAFLAGLPSINNVDAA